MALIDGAILLLAIAATRYDHPYVGRPLYCDRGQGLVYAETTTPWVALDVTEFKSGRVRCGDPVLVRFQDGTTLRARALDAGNLYDHYIADLPLPSGEGRGEGGLPIAVDVPTHLAPFPGLSAPAQLHLPALSTVKGPAARPHLTR
jgi:hypothetical protein